MDEKPENFVVIGRGDKCIIKRNLEMPKVGTVSFDVTLKIAGNPNPTLMDLHRASAEAVIRYLLTLLPEDFEGRPFLPGQEKSSRQ